jgi:uncharacterized protein YbgA (DUF1722 family)
MAKEKTDKIRIGISACLLGERVRYDGGHKHERFLTEVLGGYFEWVPVCPELEAGMGVPREAVHLEGPAGAPRMVGSKSGEDWTDRMNTYSGRKVGKMSKMDICGFIFKSKSPSCGMERVKIYNAKGMATKNGRGLFTAVFIKNHPLIPVEEEGRLNDPENFIERIFAYYRLSNLMLGRFTLGKLVAFHTAEKYLLLAHSPVHYRKLGSLVADAKKMNVSVLKERYFSMFMEALRVRSTVKKNVNVLQHIMGYLPDKIAGPERNEILQVIEDYRWGFVPLVVPVTLLRHYVRTHSVEYIMGQVYLNPHPKELMLRNHV